jgi:membrane protein implicated in regulation of membrane protease activity
MLRNFLSLLIGIVFLILGVMFSVVALAIVAILGLAFWAYLTWKKRKLGSVLKQQTMDNQVIEGEATIVDDDVSHTDKVLPPIQTKIYRN